jgi:hypothetical protein
MDTNGPNNEASAVLRINGWVNGCRRIVHVSLPLLQIVHVSLYRYSRQCSAYTYDFLPRFDLKGDPSEHWFLPLSWVTEVSVLEDDVTFKLLRLQLRCDAMRCGQWKESANPAMEQEMGRRLQRSNGRQHGREDKTQQVI